MIQKLDDHIEKRYVRPNDDWVEVPVQTIDDNGELKIVTERRRSLRKKRQIFTVSCTAFTIGLLMILMSSPYSKEFLVPGGLSSNHGQILAGQGADRCAACHGAADGSLSSWISSTISIGKAKGLSQSELCMKCHDETFAMDTSLNPHNVEPEMLAEKSKKHQGSFFDAKMGFSPPIHSNNIACSACHREHHGADHDLAYMTDKQCQSCHANSFHSFETDHPEFASYPLKRRSQISFDHTTHFGKHFPSKQKEFNCQQCHIDDSFTNVKRTAPFEQSCAECHNQQILDSSKQGLALIALPMIDTDAIEKAKLQVGTWPLAATGDFDGQIPPIMKIMLMADSKASEILTRYGTDFEFSDFDAAEPAQVKDAVELVWAIKRLMYDLATDGPRAVRSKIESVVKIEVSDEEIQELLSNVDESVFQIAVRSWLPNLTVEVAADRSEEPSPKEKEPKEKKSNEVAEGKHGIEPSEVSWWPAEQMLQMNIAPLDDDLLAPNPLKGLIEANHGSATAPAANVAITDNGDSENGSEVRPLPPLPSQESKPTVLSLRQDTDVSGHPELLAINPLKSTGGSISVNQSGLPIQSLIDSKPNQIVGSNNPSKGTNIVPDSNVFPNVDKPRLVIPSGWFRNDDLFQISYQPSGHSDDCLESWIELVARATESNTRIETKQLFEKTLSMTSVGLCRTCHTVEQKLDKTFKVNWQTEYRDVSLRSFTKFSHGAHLIQPGLQDCSHCHSLDLNSSNAESFVSLKAKLGVSNFRPIEKANCVSCHQQGQTSNSCTQCHNYHIGSKLTGLK